MINKFIFIFLLTLLSGCQIMTKQDQISAELMPREVALSIFSKYGVNNVEIGFGGSKSIICGGARVYDVKIQEVWSAIYFASTDRLVFRSRGNIFGSGCLVLSRFDNVKSVEDAKLLVKAAMSLGANITHIDFSP